MSKDKKDKPTFAEQMKKAAKVITETLKELGNPPIDDSFGSKKTNAPKK